MNRALSTVLATMLLGSVALPAEAGGARNKAAARDRAIASKQKLKVTNTKADRAAAAKLAAKQGGAKAPVKMQLSVAETKPGTQTKTSAKVGLGKTSKMTLKVADGSTPPPLSETSAAPAPTIAKGPSLGRRMLIGIGHAGAALGRSVGNFLARQVQMRPEMKEALTEAKMLRKDGQLTAAAETLRDAPMASGMWERFRAWRSKKAVMRGARKQLLAKKLDSDPAEGYSAFSTLNDARMASWLDRRGANKALTKGAINAIATAGKLGNKGRYEEAYDKLEWSLGEREQMDQHTLAVTQRLYAQAMKSADRAAVRFAKARSSADKAAMYEESLVAMNMAGVFNEMQAKVTGEPIFDAERANRVGQRLGLDEKSIGPAMDALMQKRYAAQAPAAPTAQQTPAAPGEGTQLSFNF